MEQYRRLTAKNIYDELINIDKIKTIAGQIKFNLGDVSIIVKRKDVVGNILQEWLEGWLRDRSIEYAPNPNTQMPPDIYFCPEDTTRNLLEIKAFNSASTACFHSGNFMAV